jgi:site-specific DNA recombinase
MKEKIRVLGYVRVSSDSQEENTSLSSQKRSLKDYCKSRGWILEEIYDDVGSGSNLNRPGFQEMSNHLEKNGFDGVVVTKFDRLTRSIVDGKQFLDLLHDKGKFLISIQESIDTSTPNGKMFFNLLMVFSENEREVIKERMMSGKEELVKQGKSPLGNLYGFRRNKDGEWEHVEDEVETIKRIFHSYLEFRSLSRVEEYLRERGIVNRKGKPFSRQSIRNILIHEQYTGKGFRYGGKLIKGNVERVVSTQQWNSVGKMLEENRKR